MPLPGGVDRKFIKTGLYRHYKGAVYSVLCVAYHSETLEPLVHYQGPDGVSWVRPYSMFLDKVKLKDGRVVPRFEFIEGG